MVTTSGQELKNSDSLAVSRILYKEYGKVLLFVLGWHRYLGDL